MLLFRVLFLRSPYRICVKVWLQFCQIHLFCTVLILLYFHQIQALFPEYSSEISEVAIQHRKALYMNLYLLLYRCRHRLKLRLLLKMCRYFGEQVLYHHLYPHKYSLHLRLHKSYHHNQNRL